MSRIIDNNINRISRSLIQMSNTSEGTGEIVDQVPGTIITIPENTGAESPNYFITPLDRRTLVKFSGPLTNTTGGTIKIADTSACLPGDELTISFWTQSEDNINVSFDTDHFSTDVPNPASIRYTAEGTTIDRYTFTFYYDGIYFNSKNENC